MNATQRSRLEEPQATTPSHVTPGRSHRRSVGEIEFGRRTLFIAAALLSPVALALLYNSVGLLQAVGATGTPLGSPGGQLGLLVSAILIALISHSSRWSTIGPAALTFWAGAFAVVLMYETWSSSSQSPSEIEALLQWSQLPTIVFFICCAATLATRFVRRRREHGELRGSRSKYEGLMITISAFLLSFAILVLLYAIAPRTVAPLIIRTPEFMSPPGANTVLLAPGIALIAFVITWLATRSVLGVQLAAWIVLLIPGIVLVPLITTLSGAIATPGQPDSIALAMTMPVAGVVGLVIAVTTHGIALMHKR
ncbi:MAG: hypothetical protein Q4P71_03185 [Actinomycetaceae bacterium]|nr:hypothetical protein [Actinomycetaceae bacterium]